MGSRVAFKKKPLNYYSFKVKKNVKVIVSKLRVLGHKMKSILDSKIYTQVITLEAEFKEFEPYLKFKTRLKYGWFDLKLYIQCFKI